MEGMLGAGSFREFYYVAQENLELVASPEVDHETNLCYAVCTVLLALAVS